MKRIRLILLMMFSCLWLSTSSFAQTLAAQFSAVDERIAANALHDTLEYDRSGVASTWRNPDSQISGMSQSLNTFQTADDSYCREFLETVIIAGHRTDAYGTACRQTDGHWKIVSADHEGRASVQRMTSQPVKRAYPPSAHGPASSPAWWYPGYRVFGFSFYDDHHRSHDRSGKYRDRGHRHSYSHRGKDGYRGWNRHRKGWDDRRGRGRGGDDRHKGWHD